MTRQKRSIEEVAASFGIASADLEKLKEIAVTANDLPIVDGLTLDELVDALIKEILRLSGIT